MTGYTKVKFSPMLVFPYICYKESANHFEFTSLQDSGELDLDKSSELTTFHEAVSNLVESEEQLIEEHKSITQADQEEQLESA